MGCCDKTRRLANTTKHIAQGWTALARGTKYEFTDDRVRVCQGCEDNYWIGGSLWCSICKCLIPAKARVEGEDCPKGRWVPLKEI